MAAEIYPLPKKIIKNTLYNTAGNWIVMGLNIFVIPFVVGKLGVELYGGAWVIGIIVLSSTALLDWGIGSSSVKYISQYNAKQQYEKINEFVNTGIFSYSVFGIILLLMAVLFGEAFLLFLGVPVHLINDAYFVFYISIFTLAVINTLSPITSTVVSLQRMDISNIITVSTSLLNIIQTVIVLSIGLGIRGLIIGYLLVQTINIVLFLGWAFKLLPQLKLNYRYAKWETFKIIWRFGINLQVSRISQIIVFQLDKIFVLRFFGVSYTAYYEVAVKIATLARSIPLVLASALLPASSEMDSKNEDVKVKILFERSSKYLIILGTMLLGYIFIESSLIIRTWMGTTLGEQGIILASITVKFLIVGYFINMTTGIASVIAAGINRTELERNVGLISLVIGPVFMIGMIMSIGYYGVGISTSLVLAIGAVYFVAQFCSALEYKMSVYWKLFYKPFSGLVVAALISETFSCFINRSAIQTRFEGLLLIILFFVIFSISYALTLVLLKEFDDYDKSIMNIFLIKLNLKKN
jgi:O-antigen/teichoic acid export membrane protein